MKPKQLIERNLKFANQYYYHGITRGSVESGQVTCCDNCGKLITNMVTVIQKDANKKFTIGTDCAETIAKAGSLFQTRDSDYSVDLFAFNQCTRFATELNKGKAYTENFIFLETINDKGKVIQAYKSSMQKFYPELLK